MNEKEGKISWECPSNIALVKYWGKKGPQLPSNSSISFVLDNAITRTTLSYEKHEKRAEDVQVEFYFNGKIKESFQERVLRFFSRINVHCPFLNDYKYIIESENTFPHSAGIASSASSLGALALCITSMDNHFNAPLDENEFFKKASFLARLGSGSACRSVYGGFSQWGEHPDFKNSSDEYAVNISPQVHSVFNNFNDTVLILHSGEKAVSSTEGHALINNHPFALQRFSEANKNCSLMLNALKFGNLNEFVQIVETEALMLHAMMLTSNPPYILMKPNTLEVIQKVWEFREDTQSQLAFTLDAGANVHLLYPEHDESKVVDFIKSELLVYCDNETYICNRIGNGPRLLLDHA
jgi:diphosphomevalonate decarboxylase